MRIGLFLKNLDEEYQISIYKGVRAEAEALDIDLICVQGEMPQYNLGREGDPFPSRKFLTVDGILFLSSVLLNSAELPYMPGSFGQPETAKTRAEFSMDFKALFGGIPVVSLGSRLPGIPSIYTKSRKSMKALLDHLVVFHGYRNILYIGGPVNHPDNIVREGIFRAYIGRNKKHLDGLKGTILNGEFLEMSGMVIARDYYSAHAEDPPDVIIAANDNMAIGVQGMLQTLENGRWRDCPVTGFDDINQARFEAPALTTVRQSMDEIGRLGVRTLRDLISGRRAPAVIQLESELIIRNSCGCAAVPADIGDIDLFPDSGLSGAGYRAIKSEYHLRNVSLLGQSLATVNSLGETLPHVQFFLTNLDVKYFYLILYGSPLPYIGSTGNLVFRRVPGEDESFADNLRPAEFRDFFNDITIRDRKGNRAWCVSHLRFGSECLGLIVYEAPDTVHPQLGSAAIFLANTVKRLLIHEDEQERSRRLEREVAFRTRDLLEANRKLQEEAKRRMEVEAEILRISEMERLRFSMDLHDDICQRLAGISMYCKSFSGESRREEAELKAAVNELSLLIDETLQRTRRYAHDSFPVELDSLGLRNALDALCRRVGEQAPVNCVYTWSPEVPSPLAPAQEINVYRIVQEALQNAVKHAGADRVTVDIRAGGAFFAAVVEDNGRGDPLLMEDGAPKNRKGREGLGLRSMRYRAHQLGAEYRFSSSAAGGTRVEIRVPLKPEP
jgi:signal transduction histidine kinase